jgi:ATP-dependent helicase/nuclease subunit B
MRASFGLPAPERLIGQSALEMYLLCAGPEVILTRSNKLEGTPTVPSRWLVRLETLVKGLNPQYFESMRKDQWYGQGVMLLDAPIPIPPYPRPAPLPPLTARPRQLRVTAVDTWLRDPYMVYAQYILKLRKLEKLDKEPDAADFGTLVHKALELFTQLHPSILPSDAHEQLLQCGSIAFAESIEWPAVACLWWPRFEVMSRWLIEREKERRDSIAQVLSELEGKWELIVDGKPFVLTTRIDRLEIDKEGGIAIADYKTGTVPSQSDIEAGLANQLLLEALIAKYGTLQPAIASLSNVVALEYWKLSGNPEDCEIKNMRVEGLDEARARLENLIRLYDDASQTYIAQNDTSKMPRFNDYKHLTRAQEWEAV